MSDLADKIGCALADGTMTENDAAEIHRFAAFLEDAGPPDGSTRDKKRAAAAWKKHYPEDYAKALAEHEARTQPEGPTHGQG